MLLRKFKKSPCSLAIRAETFLRHFCMKKGKTQKIKNRKIFQPNEYIFSAFSKRKKVLERKSSWHDATPRDATRESKLFKVSTLIYFILNFGACCTFRLEAVLSVRREWLWQETDNQKVLGQNLATGYRIDHSSHFCTAA